MTDTGRGRAAAGRRRRWGAAAATAMALGAAAVLAGADWRTPAPAGGLESVALHRLDGEPYVGVNDLARLLDATKYWRGDLRRLTLRTGTHSLVLIPDNPFVVLDGRALWLDPPVRSLGGEVQVPVGLVDSLPADPARGRLFVDRHGGRLLRLPASGSVGGPKLVESAGVLRLTFPADRPDDVTVVSRARRHFRLRFSGHFTGALPESLPAEGLLESIVPIAAAAGSAFELRLAAGTAGYRLRPDPGAGSVVLEFAREAAAGMEAFAPEAPPGPRGVRVVVLDPGHGGSDTGVMAGGAMEKDLTLALARLLRTELERRLAARVLLTREEDRRVGSQERAELANRARADLVLSLHFDGLAAPGARGVTAYCPPASHAAPAGGRGAPPPVLLLPWRNVGERHAVDSRELAEAVLSALDLRGLGPARLRERLPYPLLGVNAPGLLLECATLTAAADRERVASEDGLRDLAAAIAAGVESYQRNP